MSSTLKHGFHSNRLSINIIFKPITDDLGVWYIYIWIQLIEISVNQLIFLYDLYTKCLNEDGFFFILKNKTKSDQTFRMHLRRHLSNAYSSHLALRYLLGKMLSNVRLLFVGIPSTTKLHLQRVRTFTPWTLEKRKRKQTKSNIKRKTKRLRTVLKVETKSKTKVTNMIVM